MTLQSRTSPTAFGFALAAHSHFDVATLLSRLGVLRTPASTPRRFSEPPSDVERLTPTIVDAAVGLCALSEVLAAHVEVGELPASWPARVPVQSMADAATALALAASLLDLIIEDCLDSEDQLAPGLPQRLRNARRLLRDGLSADLETVADADLSAWFDGDSDTDADPDAETSSAADRGTTADRATASGV